MVERNPTRPAEWSADRRRPGAPIYRSPATLFTARFIGAGSFFPADVHACRDGYAEVAAADRRFRALDAGVTKGTAAQVLLRPEELEIRPADDGVLAGIVQTCSVFGPYFDVLTSTPQGPCRLRLRDPLAPGEQLSIGWADTVGIAYPAG